MFKSLLLFACCYLSFILHAQQDSTSYTVLNFSKSSSTELIKYLNDSVQTDNLGINKHTTGNILAQAFVGSVCAGSLAILPFSAIITDQGNKKTINTNLLIISIVTYTCGASLGVHWIAKAENPNHSFWLTQVSSIISLGIGVGVAVSGIEDPPYVTVVIVALSPIVGSIIYSTSIADWSDPNQNPTLQPKNFSHKDLVNRSKMFELEIIKISL